jgi:hypothetical protein
VPPAYVEEEGMLFVSASAHCCLQGSECVILKKSNQRFRILC